MITEMRKQFRSTATRFTLLVMSATLVISLIIPVFKRKEISSGPWILRVNSHDISYKDFAHELAHKRQLVAAVRSRFKENADQLLAAMGMASDPRSSALDSITYNELIMQAAQKSGIVVHNDYIVQKLYDTSFINRYLSDYIPPFVIKEGKIDLTVLKESLKRYGMSVAEFEEKLYQIVTRNLLQEIAGCAVYVPSFEKNLYKTQELSSRSYAVIQLPLESALQEAKKESVGSIDLKKFFDEQNSKNNRYLVPEKRIGQVWEFDSAHYGIEVSKEDVKAYYDAHKTQKYVDSPTRITVRHATFDDLEKATAAYTEVLKNPNLLVQKSKDFGVTIDSFSRGEKEESFEKAAFLLKNDGDVSPVIKTNNGYQIVQRIERKPIAYKPLDTVASDIRKVLLRRAFQESFMQDVKNIVAARENNIDNFAKQKHATVCTIETHTASQGQALKELLSLKKNGYASYIENGKGYLVHLSDIKKAYIPELKDELQKKVENDFYQDKAEKLLAERVSQAKVMLSEKTPAQVASILGGSVYMTDPVSRYSKQVQHLEKQSISLTHLLSLDRVGLVASYKVPTGAHVVRLERIENSSSNNERSDAGGQDISKALEQENMQFFAQGFLASLHRNATIETNPTIVQL